ncbi:MAG: hypothetical protein ACJA2S_005596 [Cyclobacteriaceae bacterium]|jgi:hypothetical protein
MKIDEELKIERDKIVIGLECAYEKVVTFKKEKNTPMVVSRNGEIVEIQPVDIPPTTSYKR